MTTPFDFGSMSWKQNSSSAQNRTDASAFQLEYPDGLHPNDGDS